MNEYIHMVKYIILMYWFNPKSCDKLKWVTQNRNRAMERLVTLKSIYI